MRPFCIRTVRCANGERLPTLLRRDTGIPEFDVTLWVVSCLRVSNLSSSTIEQALRSVEILYSVLYQRNIDLTARARAGEFLSLPEVSDILHATKLTSLARNQDERVINFPNSQTTLERLRSKNHSPLQNAVQPTTAAIRITYIRSYLEWMFNHEIIKHKKEDRQHALQLKSLILDTLRQGTPTAQSGSTLHERMGLAPQQLKNFRELISPNSNLNPWKNDFARSRNQVIGEILIATGIRRSELLGLQITDLQPRIGEIYIERRPDDQSDPRLDEPNTKTVARALPIDRPLWKLIDAYLIKRHKLVRGRHPYLITSKTGEPLSKSALNRLFKKISGIIAPTIICPHILRHTYFENLAENLYDQGCSDTKMLVILRRLGGWQDNSDTPTRYIKRFLQIQAGRASLEMQRKMRISKGGEQ